MKKIYNKPAIEVVDIATNNMLLASELGVYDEVVNGGLSREAEFSDELFSFFKFEVALSLHVSYSKLIKILKILRPQL